ncbi:Thiol-disulfide interchange protein, contains DsbC and DsbD domains [Devosia lucknowensis]|uniref:Thiol-disulfide interchange protein, contains DsbC and DsbD domains n=1 Tax=Devosia lucknowensis TaxID=1096929 RepID=A0A1Y6EEU0_9HYPH|nr:protein-disulfide reductase DsbD domain-containing protein [Devosia lucknowensis]SMQ59701.1 Thiol-disulfide interchange protein, contains DsbC and DsbD domains [Devosia lucknowensis]
MRVSSLVICCLFATVVPAHAGETAWQELAPGVQLRLISSGTVDAAGSALFALEIDMPDTTKTYWRVPGETGLPIDLDFGSSVGISGYEIHWPMPTREAGKGVLDYVYYGHTILPIELDVGDPHGIVDVTATLGICSEICIPAQARLTLPASDGDADGGNALRIRQAMAQVPIAWDQGAEPAGAVRIAEDGAAIVVEVDPSVVDPASLIVAGDLEAPLFGAPQKSPQDDLVVLPIVGKTIDSALEGMEVELSFMTPMGAYEVSRTIETGGDVAANDSGH